MIRLIHHLYVLGLVLAVSFLYFGMIVALFLIWRHRKSR